MTSPLPSDGPQREIFIRALRDFSVACEMPDLTPHCPFYEVTSQGPACGEQCIDLLGELDGGDRITEPIRFGYGYQFHGRQAKRPRRGPKPNVRPFDAAQIVAREADLPRDEQQITSLLYDLISSLATSSSMATDAGEREYRIRASSAELSKRGFDVEEIIRLGFGHQIALGITFHNIVLPRLNENIKLPIDVATPDAQWVALFEQSQPPSAQVGDHSAVIAFAMTTFARLVRKWIVSANLDDVVNWVAPDSLDGAVSAQIDRMKAAGATWLTERFLLTYLEDWEPSSLLLEWKYLHGEYTASCLKRYMLDRQIDAGEVAKAIADNAVGDWRRDSAVPSAANIRVEEFARIAIENLVAGRRQVSVAIYSSLAEICPDDSSVRNNHGFCLLPDDPELALCELVASDDLGYRPRGTNVANRVLALHLLKRDAEALELASDFLSGDPDASQNAWLWDFVGSTEELVLREVSQNVNLYIRNLARRIMDRMS